MNLFCRAAHRATARVRPYKDDGDLTPRRIFVGAHPCGRPASLRVVDFISGPDRSKHPLCPFILFFLIKKYAFLPTIQERRYAQPHIPCRVAHVEGVHNEEVTRSYQTIILAEYWINFGFTMLKFFTSLRLPPGLILLF